MCTRLRRTAFARFDREKRAVFTASRGGRPGGCEWVRAPVLIFSAGRYQLLLFLLAVSHSLNRNNNHDHGNDDDDDDIINNVFRVININYRCCCCCTL